MRSEARGCHLAWSTLAGVAMVESRHGTSGGAAIDAAGRNRTPNKSTTRH